MQGCSAGLAFDHQTSQSSQREMLLSSRRSSRGCLGAGTGSVQLCPQHHQSSRASASICSSDCSHRACTTASSGQQCAHDTAIIFSMHVMLQYGMPGHAEFAWLAWKAAAGSAIVLCFVQSRSVVTVLHSCRVSGGLSASCLHILSSLKGNAH